MRVTGLVNILVMIFVIADIISLIDESIGLYYAKVIGTVTNPFSGPMSYTY